ncbi:MAG TPA: hypothetical protein VG992_02530, partial [Candidatus Saccharimonadales bacterium]|nr:hypothetical protein [Candidatus Saccharimonadales bacterium]
MSLPVHPVTERQLSAFVGGDHHALLLVGQPGSGKLALAQQAAADSLQTPLARLDAHPYVRIFEAADGQAIGIETIREVEHFLRLKVPGQEQ